MAVIGPHFFETTDRNRLGVPAGTIFVGRFYAPSTDFHYRHESNGKVIEGVMSCGEMFVQFLPVDEFGGVGDEQCQ